ncbi:TonB-dependent receptor [Gaoshiqia sp. Z1-71]|uniref:TonB-dependent receptor n=1 Tax=Gaoshiqia hydrogeniformans TaxID=3290090 RepID=UPI003BF867D6
MKKIIFVALLFTCSLFTYSENNPTIRKPDTMLFGDVTSDDGHIPFASIQIKGTTIGTAADLTGHFKLVAAPVGKQTVVISAIGYRTREYVVELISGTGVTLMAKLDPDQIGLEQVVVSADRSEKSRRETATIVSAIGPRLFERTQSVTLSEGLNFTPGVRIENNCQNCGFTQIRMNGMEGPYSQILINSRPVFSGLAGVYGLELIPANMIDRVEVVRGGGSALFGGNAIAGTINLITKEPVKNSFSVNSSAAVIGKNGLSDSNLTMNGSMISDDFRTGMSFYGFKRGRDPYDANDDGFSEISKIDNATLGGSLFHRLGTRSKINLDYFYINESRRGGNAFDKPNHEADISEAVDHRINSANLSVDKFMRGHDKLSIYTAFQSVDRDSYYGANHDLSAYGNTKDFSVSAGAQYHRDVEKLLVSPSELVVGMEMTTNQLEDKKLGYLDLETREHTNNTLIANQHINTYGFFVQNEWVGDQLRLGIGFRAEHYSVGDDEENRETASGDVISPRVSLLYNLSRKLQLRSSFAKGYRAPQIFDEDLHIETSGARRVTHVNDPGLKQESSNSLTISLDYTETFGKYQAQFLAESFYTKLNDPFTNIYGDPDDDGNVIYTRTNAEDGAVVRGINFELNASAGARFVMQSSLTLQQSKYESPQEFDEYRFFRTPETYGYLSMTYSSGPLFRASLTGNYTGKMLVPYFGNLLDHPENGQLNRTDSFFDLGVKLSRDLKIGNELSLQLYGGVKNILDSFQDDFDYGADRDPGYIYGPLAPRTFYLGVKIGNIF